jgi:hypothetical protein
MQLQQDLRLAEWGSGVSTAAILGRSCLLWVIKRHRPLSPRRPLYPKSGHFDYSITSSAMVITLDGMFRRSVFAVLRLIAGSNLVGCATGRSDGFSPFTTRAT